MESDNSEDGRAGYFALGIGGIPLLALAVWGLIELPSAISNTYNKTFSRKPTGLEYKTRGGTIKENVKIDWEIKPLGEIYGMTTYEKEYKYKSEIEKYQVQLKFFHYNRFLLLTSKDSISTPYQLKFEDYFEDGKYENILIKNKPNEDFSKLNFYSKGPFKFIGWYPSKENIKKPTEEDIEKYSSLMNQALDSIFW